MRKPQDEAAGLAEARDEHGAAYAELDAGVLYREAQSSSVRVARAAQRNLPA